MQRDYEQALFTQLSVYMRWFSTTSVVRIFIIINYSFSGFQ